MGFERFSWVLLLLWVFTFFCLKAHCANVSVNFFKAPLAVTSLTAATFGFQVFEGSDVCTNCSIKCKLDEHTSSDCEDREVSYMGLHDGHHTLEVCINGSRGVGCATYNWIVDTVPPTAYITAASPFTNALNFSVDITFSELCPGGGGFSCAFTNSCNLFVFGPAQVISSTLKILQPDLKFSLMVGISSNVQYGRVVMVMDKNFCTDVAGNRFQRTANSSYFVHFDRRSVFVNLRTHIPEKLLQLNMETRTVEATNNYENLKVYLYFSEPIINSSAEILSSLHINEGLIVPTNGETKGNRRFGFLVKNTSSMAIITVSFNSSSITSRQGTHVSPIAPVTFLYDSSRPTVRLRTTSNMRTKEPSVPVIINFVKPVFGFNSSTLSISGGHVQSFHEISRRIYSVYIHAVDSIVSVNVPENITRDVAGNGNLASNILQVRHYTMPVISCVVSTFVTATFTVTSLTAGLLTVSTASLQSIGAPSKSSFTTDPARSLFRIICHIQFFALSRWLAVPMPIEYYEFTKGLQWSIPYLSLPWETRHVQSNVVGPSAPYMTHTETHKIHESGMLNGGQFGDLDSEKAVSVFGLPLTPVEYISFFESHNIKPEADHILHSQNSNGWKDFTRNMFWLGVIGGGLMLLHALLLFIFKCRGRSSEDQKSYGTLMLPRFEIFLIILALPCTCQASTALVRGARSSGTVVGVFLLGLTAFLLLALFLFLSIGITLGKLLQYKEVHQEGQKFHWYQEIIRVTLGPGKRGQWTWKNQSNSDNLTMLGPLFEDLRGPPKYMLSQIAGGGVSRRIDRIIASDDETEDAEAPFIQKLFGILRIYYTLLECVKRVALGIFAGAYSGDGSCKTEIVVMLCITSFQLFFLVLKKPFIKKKVQFVEILSVTSEVGIFATCLVLLEREFSFEAEKRIGLFMLLLFLVAFTAQVINEWYALYRQTSRLDPDKNSFLSGLKAVSVGLLLILIPWKLLKNLDSGFLSKQSNNVHTGETGSSSERFNRSSGSRSSGERPWVRQLREMAKASFSKDRNGPSKDPSSSQTFQSRFWSGKRSRSSSLTSSADFKTKPKSLHSDMEAIFSS